jgi:hypothetical protein
MRNVFSEQRTYYMLRISLILMLGFVLATAAAYGQGNASIVGTVTDVTGAVIPSAQVTITNTDTGFIRATETNATGSYSARELAIGPYEVRVEAGGFKTYQETGITLSVNDTVRADATLEVGEMVESVTVEANAIQVQADSNEISQTVTDEMVAQLATNGRNVLQLAALVPGAASSMPDFDSPMAQNQNRSISYNGQRADHNNWIVNGGEAYDRGAGGILIVSPSQDALQEFKVMTSNFSANLGQSSGGMITMVTKSGTREYHGGAWEYLRNDKIDASSFFSNLNDQPKPQLRYNTFGFNFGGPVPTPGEKKLFFFYNMEWRRLVTGREFNATAIPSEAKSGDFSSLATAITVPQTDDPEAIAKFAQYGLSPGDVFPNNQIPAGLIDSNAQLLINSGMWPDANTAGGRFYKSAPNRQNYREELARVDYQPTNKLTLMGSLIYDNGTSTEATPIWTGNTYPTVGSAMIVPSWQAVVHATYTISPTLLNEVAFNHNGNNMDINPVGLYEKPSGYDVQQFFPETNEANKLPAVSIRAPYSVSYGPGNWPWANTWRSYQWKDDVSWVRGRHNLKFGFAYMYTHKNQDIFGNTGGNYTFNGRFTGNSFADYLLGFASAYNEPQVRDFVSITNHTYSAYALDDWRVNNRLTLNLGIRWEGIPHAYDTNNRLSNFYPERYDPALAPTFLDNGALDPDGPGFATVPGIALSDVKFYLNGVGLAGRDGVPKGLVENTWNTFAPRIGFALDLTGRQKTVLRAGVGMFYERLAGNEEYNMGANSPFSFTPNAENVYLSNPASSVLTGAQVADAPTFPGGMTTLASDYKIPTALQFSLGIQQQLAPGSVMTVSYVGNSNYHQSMGRHINTLAKDDPNRLAVCGGTCGYTGTSVNANLYRPYLGWAGIAPLEFGQTSNYHSLQVTFRTQTWKNLTVNSAYTWSHAMDIIDGELFANISNPWDAGYDRASSGYDRRHVFITSFIYDIPLFQNTTGLTKTLLGGWQLSGIATFQSGTPTSVGYGTDNLGYGGGTSNRADILSPVTYPETREEWFSTSSFAVPGALQWGTSGRNIIVTPGRNNWNMALFKVFQIKENLRLEFRAESFNTFNHTQFNSLSTSVTNGDFGQLNGTYDPRTLQFGAKLMF